MADISSWRTIQLHGGAPWGFRISDSNIHKQPGLHVSKVRTRSKAHVAGLRDNDSILFINDFPTHSMTLQAASDLIESADTLNLVVFNSSAAAAAIRKSSETKYSNLFNENSYYNTKQNNINSFDQEYYRKDSATNYLPSYASTIKQNNNLIQYKSDQSEDKMNVGRRVLSNPSLGRFALPNDTTNKQLNQRYDSDYSNYNSAYQVNNNNNNNSNYRFHNDNLNSKRRNYYSATESCGEETDNDSVFDDHRPKQSYASITLKPRSKDLNYFSDTEAIQNNTSRNYYKVKQPPQFQSQTKQYNQFNSAPHQASQLVTNQQNIPIKVGGTPVKKFSQVPLSQSQTMATSSQQNNFSSYGKPFNSMNRNIDIKNENQYSSLPNAKQQQTLFKVPNIYEKLNINQSTKREQGFNQYTPDNLQTFMQQDVTPATNRYPSTSVDSTQKPSNLEDEERKRYEAEMGTELMKPSLKPHYSDSYFYNSSVYHYPTVDEQKKMAKVIASTLEGSDPDSSKYHQYKKKQPEPQQYDEFNNSYERQQSYPRIDSFTTPSPTAKTPGYNAFVFDENIPEIIRKSIEQAEMHDPVRMVHAPEEFRQLHYTQHNTHTEMPPQAAMSLAAALHESGGRGAQIFQKRKARSEKWVVDENNVKKSPTAINASFFGQHSQPMNKLGPEKKTPTPIVPQKHEDNNANKFGNFNVKPKGWNSNDDYKPPSTKSFGPQPERIQPRLSIDHSIREGIQELHFRNESNQKPSSPLLNYQQNKPSVSHDETNSYSKLLENHPNKLDLSNWTSRKDESNGRDLKSINISKDGIQNLKQRFSESTYQSQPKFSSVSSSNDRSQTKYNTNYEPIRLNLNDQNFKPIPVISKVKLNRLNADEFLRDTNTRSFNMNSNMSNPYSRQQQTQQHQQVYNVHLIDDDVAASDL